MRLGLGLLGACALLSVSTWWVASAGSPSPTPGSPVPCEDGRREVALFVGPARIDETGAHLAAGLRLRLAAVGRVGAMRATIDAPPFETGAEVHLDRGEGVVEWWREASGLLEHGVTLQRRPEGTGELALELEVGARAVRSSEDGSVELTAHDGTRARYGSLTVLDARGSVIPAQLRPRGDRVVIAVDDDEARYPLIIDPLFEVISEGVLTRPSGCPNPGLGEALAISPAGDYVVLGAPSIPNCTVFGSNAGGVFLYGRTGATWSLLAVMQDITTAGDQLGRSVSLSDDGNTVVALSRIDARVISRVGSVLAVADYLSPAPTDCRSITTNAAANRIVVGCPASSPSVDGSVWMWQGTAGSYARTAVPIPAGSGSRAGTVVALDATGDRLLVTSPGGTPRAVVMRYAAGTWSLEATLIAPTLPPPDEIGSFGDSASFTRDGARAIVSAYTLGNVAAFTFHRTGSSWAHDGTLTSTSSDSSEIGASVAMDTSGTRAAVGAPGTNLVRLFTRSPGGTWIEDDAPEAVMGPLAGSRFGTAVALSSDGERLAVGAPSSSPGSGHVVRLTPGLALGATCTRDTACLSDRCVDGVCCDDRCGSDCDACRASDTGLADGRCAPVLAARARSCRASTGGCNPADTCNGLSAACPDDVRLASGVTCRASAGDCDPAEVCDGASDTCPGDVLEPPGSTCGDEDTDCSLPGICNGVSPLCTGAVGFRPFGYICGPVDPLNPCDASDVCDGGGVCLEQSAPASAPCGLASIAGPCDAPDHCAGADVGAFCIPAVLAGVECRPATGSCDLPETCDGTNVTCPGDGLLAPGVVCRASTDASCDPVESCDGASAMCPADQTTCEPDAGALDSGTAPALDVGTAGSDAGVPSAATGCSCRAIRDRGPSWAWLGLAMPVIVALRRRARRAGRCSRAVSRVAGP